MLPPPISNTASPSAQNLSAGLDPLITLYQGPSPDGLNPMGAVNQSFTGVDPDSTDPRHLAEIQQWTDALNTDCFGADLTAFLRGESVDWSVDPATLTPNGVVD